MRRMSWGLGNSWFATPRLDDIYYVQIAPLSSEGALLTLSSRDEGEIFGAHLRSLRAARGMTQAQLAENARTSTPFISQLERGVTTPTLGMLLRLADALECRPSELIKIFDRGPHISPRSRKD
jgi:DNA-binding XRE family transcriptional regulator